MIYYAVKRKSDNTYYTGAFADRRWAKHLAPMLYTNKGRAVAACTHFAGSDFEREQKKLPRPQRRSWALQDRATRKPWIDAYEIQEMELLERGVVEWQTRR